MQTSYLWTQERGGGFGSVRTPEMSDLELPAKLNAERSEVPIIRSSNKKDTSSQMTTSEDLGLPVDESRVGSGRQTEGRKSAEERLPFEAQLQATLNVIPACTFYALPSGALTFVNERTADYLGLPKDHPLRFGKSKGAAWDSHLHFVHPHELGEARKVWSTCLRTGRSGECSLRVRDGKGEYRWFLSRAEPLRASDGTLLYWVGVNLDIEDRKRAEEELRRSEAYLSEAQRLSQTGSFGWDVSSGEIDWSEETFRIFELDPKTKITIDLIVELTHPDDRAAVQQLIERASRERTEFHIEHRLLMPNGSTKYLRVVSRPSIDDGRDSEFVGAVTDITDQKRAEEGLRRSEAYLAEAQRLSHTGSFGCKFSTGEMFWSEETFGIFGYHRATTPATEAILQRVHPEDKARVQEHMHRAASEGKGCDLEYRLLMPDDSVKHVHVVAHAAKDEPGRFEFVGAVVDVTDSKRAEEELRQSEAELRQILDLAPQHIGVFGPSGSPLYLNQVGLEYFGTTVWRADPGQLKATRPWTGSRLDLVHPEDREHFISERKKGFLEGRPFEHEARLLRHDGQFRCFLIRFAPIRDERGDITRWCGIGTDIEDRKRAEEDIREENIALREEIIKASMFEEIVGNSPPLQQVLSRVAKVAPTDSTVLITGETGTGKELIARAIHKASKRSARAFVSVNCAAIPPSLIPSELFGHEKGAFTGATGRRLGRFELAEGGTIFLDEVCELPPETQVALLRVLQEREFERVGGSRSIKANVRVIVATNRDLESAIAEGRFRSDLFYRLNVFPIELPPLRQRREDIPMLVQYFIDRFARELGKNMRAVSKETLDLFRSYAWPGNIRELRNVIERSIIICDTESFSVDESWLSRQTLPAQPTGKLELRQRLADQEREAIEAALTESCGRVFGPSGAAARLGIARSTLESKIRTLKIDKNRFKISKSTLQF